MNDYNYYRISNIEITSKSKKKLLLWKYCILYDKWVCMMDMFVDTWEQRKLEDIYGSIGNAFVGTATPYYVESGHF